MNTITQEERRAIKQKTAKPMLWLGIVSIVMLFAGLTSAYVVSRGKQPETWFRFDMPSHFYISCIIIALSSITIWWAHASIKKGNVQNLKTGLLLTLALGVAFCWSQFMGYAQLINQGVFLVSKDVSGSYLYILSFMHIVHLSGGMVGLIIAIFKAFNNKYSAENWLGVDLVATYWHFMDILWIYLCLFLYYIH
jgi:cytochrome c oxidase subunit 3